jgi:carbonic anhydrase
MSETDRMLSAAREHFRGFDKGDLPPAPTKKVAVLTCMDARIDPAALLGLSEGDAHVIRNAGGVVSDDAIRSLAVSQVLLGTREVILIQHTGCGMLAYSEEELTAKLEAEAGERPEWPVHAIADLEQGVRDGVAKIESSPFILHRGSVRGFVYEVETGSLRELSGAEPS